MSRRSFRSLRRFLNLWRSILSMIFPVVDVLARVGAGKTFLVSGMLGIGDWPVAMELARPEHPLGWLDPQQAAWLGAGVELTGSILFMLGLLTRPMAVMMLALSLAAQFSYRMVDAHLLWAALFAWYVVFGAGAISIDAAIAGGLRDSALPFADRVASLAEAASNWLGPPFKAALRLWFALALVGVGSPSCFPSSCSRRWPGSGPGSPPSCWRLAWRRRSSAARSRLLAPGRRCRLAPRSITRPCCFCCSPSPTPEAGRLTQHCVDFSRNRRWGQANVRASSSWAPVSAGEMRNRLEDEAVDVTLIDRNNYHLFQPLLYQ